MTSSKASSSGRWHKRGQIFVPDGSLDWARTHAALPCVVNERDATAVYFSGRDEKNRAHVGRFRFDPQKPAANSLDPIPVLTPGTLGAFDDSGVTVSCVIPHDERFWLYYTGWSLGVTVPFYLAIGLAVSDDGVHFERVSEAPVLGRSSVDPYMVASPCVLIEDGIWRMWYVSCQRWEQRAEGPRHYYHIRYAESRDGISWDCGGRVCLDFESDEEYAFGRPCVIKDADCYRMWYCVRGAAYRIGYAESPDGLDWQRIDDAAGIAESDTGWDSEMTAYPWVFDAADSRWMLYNGNGYGKSGIGLAEWA